jgi:hypothetical protein
MRDVFISNSGITTAPIANATNTLFDTTAGIGTGTTLKHRRKYANVKRAVVRMYVDQPVTFLAQSLTANSTTWRTYNGSGAGETVAANTYFERDVLFVGDDTMLAATAGATPPTVWEVSVRLVQGERGVAQ